MSDRTTLHNATRFLTAFAALAVLLLAESVAGLRWTPPAGWKSEGTAPMRAATYKVAASAGGEGAECVVYFFGAGQGGSVQQNMDRWAGQFTQPDGKPADAQIRKRTVHGLPVTTIDVSGAYSGMGGPMATAKTVKAGYRLLGAIIENPGGSVFLKFAGPAALIAANQHKFEELLDSFQKD